MIMSEHHVRSLVSWRPAAAKLKRDGWIDGWMDVHTSWRGNFKGLGNLVC